MPLTSPSSSGQRTPTISTVASGNVTLGGQVTDTATLAGTYNGTGTITFKLWGNATCAGSPVFTTTKPVTGNASYTSAPFTPLAAGTYRWIASYGGDANNAAVTGACGDANESVTVYRRGPALTTQASPDVLLGGAISDTAMLSGTASGTGTISFALYGPNNASCSGAPIFTGSATVSGNGNYNSGNFTPTQAGVYRWIASYSGDANNLPVQGSCNDAGESVTVGEDDSKPLCVLTEIVQGPPKQLKITVQDPESGISSIVVDAIINATTTGNTGFPAGDHLSGRGDRGKDRPVEELVRPPEGHEQRRADDALRSPHPGGQEGAAGPAASLRPVASSKFTFGADTRRVTFGAERGVTLVGDDSGWQGGADGDVAQPRMQFQRLEPTRQGEDREGRSIPLQPAAWAQLHVLGPLGQRHEEREGLRPAAGGTHTRVGRPLPGRRVDDERDVPRRLPGPAPALVG